MNRSALYRKPAAWSILWIAANSWAAPFPIELHGYYKNLFAYTDTAQNDKRLGLTSQSNSFDDYQRLRFKLDAKPTSSLQFQTHYEIRSGWGELNRIQNRLNTRAASVPTSTAFFAASERRRFLDLEGTISDSGNRRASHGIDRLFLKYHVPLGEGIIGRQPVSWGSGLLWSPTDLFTAFAPNEIDRDEKIGVDVLRATIFPSSNQSLDVVLEPLDKNKHGRVRSQDSSVALRAKTHVGEYDVAAVTARIEKDTVIGGDFSGYLGDAGFHGEWTYTWTDEKASRDYAKALVGGDYSFQAPGKPYLALEYFFNGLGTSEETDVVRLRSDPSVQRVFNRGTAYNIGVHYVGVTGRFTLSSLLTAQTIFFVQANDGSVLFFPSLSYSISQNMELAGGAYYGIGRQGSEFGGTSRQQTGTPLSYPTTVYAYLKFYF